MQITTTQKRLAYHESIWAVKEIDHIEDKRKLQLQLCKSSLLALTTALAEQEREEIQRELSDARSKVQQTHVYNLSISSLQDKQEAQQRQLKLLSEDKDRICRETVSLQKQLDYYKVAPFLLELTVDGDRVASEENEGCG